MSGIAGERPIGRLAGAQAGDSVRYHSEVDLSDTEATSTQLVLLTGRDKKVLEIGPATGYITRVLRDRGCRVTCIEVDPEAAQRAAPWSERIIVGDVEQLDFRGVFPDERFDVILLGDVLEHLVDPGELLIRCAGILDDDSGYVVASIPNVAHGSVRLALLAGRFPYTDWGLLDRTHLRFFDREGVETLFTEAGYAIREWRRKTNDPFGTELGLREEDFPPHLVEAVRSAPEALTYQFIVRAEVLRSAPSAESAVPTTVGGEVVRSSLGPLFRLEKRAGKGGTAMLARRAAYVVRNEGWGAFFRRLLRPWRWLPRLLRPKR